MTQRFPFLKLAAHKLLSPRSMQIAVRLMVLAGWLVALGLMKTQGHVPVIYFLPLLSLVSLFLLDLFAGVVCALLTSGLVLLSPAVTNEAQFALLSLLWASMLLIVAFRHNPVQEHQFANQATLELPTLNAATPTLTSFATHVNHELRTPINLIIGFSEQMLHPLNHARDPLPAAYRGDVEAIQRNAWTLQKTLAALADGASFQPNLMTASVEQIEPSKVIHEAAKLVRERYGETELSLDVRIMGTLPPLHVNRTFFRQMLLTLIQYVARSTSARELSVTAQVLNAALIIGAGTRAHVDHADSADRPRGTLTAEEEHALAFCKQFVTTAHGTLWAEGSSAERVFYVSLPCANGAHAAETRRTIIVCDDNRKVVAFFAQQLPAWQVIGVSSREELLALGGEVHPHAVVLTNEAFSLTSDEVMHKFGAETALILCPVASIDRLLRRYKRVEHLVKPVTYDALSVALQRLSVMPTSVLVLDDNHDIVQMFSQMIHSLVPAATLWKAYSGQEGLALLTEQHANLVIIDLKLPDINGLDLMPQIRALPAYRDVPILFISGISDQDIVPQSVNTSLTVHEAGLAPEALVRRIEALVLADAQ